MEHSQRETWSGRFDFILSCVGYAIGLGNIWRFPYLCFRNGGGAFLIPYFTFMVFCGVPLVFLEMSLGQFTSSTPLLLFKKFSPAFQGVGVAMLVVSSIVCVYYNIIMTWTLYYLYLSVKEFPGVPWDRCEAPWASDTCVVRENNTANYEGMRTASRDYFENFVLAKSAGIDDLGKVQWQLLICLFCSWLIVFLCVCKGIKSSGKVVYFSATFPFVVIIIMLGCGLSLDGAVDGLRFFLTPDFSKLGHGKVWLDAASQVFYSVAPGWGGFLTLASYNKFSNNLYRDAVIVPCINGFTSILAGCAVFSIIGFMAKFTGTDINDVVSKGPGLVFIVYPEAVSHLYPASLWAVVFFIMILFVGVDSQFGMFETVIGGITDLYPQLRVGNRKMYFSAASCVILALCGIPSVTQGGIYVLELIDHYAATFSLQLICLSECFLVTAVYGVDRFRADIKLMVGFTPNVIWKIQWIFITPAIILILVISQIVLHESITYDDDKPFPPLAVALGWILSMVSVVPIFVIAVYVFWRCHWDWRKAVFPTSEYMPSQLQDRLAYIESVKSGIKPRCGPSIRSIEEENFCSDRNASTEQTNLSLIQMNTLEAEDHDSKKLMQQVNKQLNRRFNETG